jgi:hypothetical protein
MCLYISNLFDGRKVIVATITAVAIVLVIVLSFRVIRVTPTSLRSDPCEFFTFIHVSISKTVCALKVCIQL